MNLVLVTALLAVCGADKLDRTYLPPASATTAGGSPGTLQTPFKTFNQGLGGLPKGGYSNDFEGVVVDAAAPGTRASGGDETGLGGPRIAYGSTDSKVGEAAFTADAAFPRVGINSGLNTQGGFGAANNFPQNVESRPERIQAARDRVSSIVKYENDVSPDKFNYAFETDNGIVAEENGIEVNGVKAQGGYSYTGDDGQVYSVTYTADEDGYRPQGDHLPTPPPIPAEILESLEKNAQEEAAGIVDDGSYNAQKYNTGEDFTKTDNGQYNNRQQIQLGNRPQSDAVTSGSFISQNNQGFVRPNSFQFGSTSSLDSSKNVAPNGNNFGVASTINPAQNTQTFDFTVPSKNEYLPPSNGFNQNQRPTQNGGQGIQSNVQPGFPTTSFTANDNSGLNKNQNTGIPAFIPLAQQKLQEDRPKRPQSNSPIFGKPTVIDSTLSIKDPFAKRPPGNRFTQNNQPNQKPQAIGGSFEVVSGNVYNSKNEYLPPRRQSNKPNQNNGNQRFQGTNSGPQSNLQSTNSPLYSNNSPSPSAFGSVSRPSLGFESSQQYNGQQIPQYTGNNLFNKIGQNSNNRPLNQDQSSLSSSLPNLSGLNKSPGTQFQYRPSTISSQTPTLKPQTELVTPLGSNFDQNKDSVPIPIIGGPDSSGVTSSLSIPSSGLFSSNLPSSSLSSSGLPSSGLPSFGSRPSNSFQGQYNSNSNRIQQASPTQTSSLVVSTVNDQSVAPVPQNVAGIIKPTGNSSPQSQPNSPPLNGQFSFSTQRPSFNQFNQQQGSDDSYYYNTPSKTFNIPTPRPQAPLFPTTSFDQSFKVTQTPFDSRPQPSNAPSTFITSQGNTLTDNSRYPKPSSLRPISPTLPTKQDEQNGNPFQTQFNKVTQASLSSFPSPTPTAAVDFEGNKIGQFGTRPLQSVDRLNKDQGFDQQNSPSQPQQNSGEIYEYNKPITLPAPQKGASSGQFGQTSQFPSAQLSQIGQSQPGSYKPSSQFGSITQQPFGQNPQSSQAPQENQAFNINNQAQTQQKPGQFNLSPSQSASPGQNSKPIQGASKFPPVYNNQGPSCCKQLGSPSQSSELTGTPQFSTQFKPNQDLNQQGSNQGSKPPQSVSTFAGVGETFGGPRKPPSFDKNGYHY